MSTFHVHVPDTCDQALTDAFGPDLDRAALEALAIEGYRSAKFGTSMVARLLGFDNRLEAERWLGSRGVYMNYSMQDLEDDRRTVERLFGKSA